MVTEMMGSTDAAAKTGGRRAFILFAILGLAAGFLVANIAAFGYWFASGGPMSNEWDCVDGEYPVALADGGSYCAPYGEPVPPGATAEPNRPLEGSR